MRDIIKGAKAADIFSAAAFLSFLFFLFLIIVSPFVLIFLIINSLLSSSNENAVESLKQNSLRPEIQTIKPVAEGSYSQNNNVELTLTQPVEQEPIPSTFSPDMSFTAVAGGKRLAVSSAPQLSPGVSAQNMSVVIK